MADNALFSSFMMLSEHLYSIFVQYIINGRTRAPPETDLMEMLPTFQFGAKTDRRALQSKFKSWAKRMHFENGYLILTNTGKIILPKERCDELIMQLHSEEHCNIEKVISLIRGTYSWTKKNFGMDRDVVVESIARNCKEEDCLKKMRLEIARLSGSFCSGLPNSQIPDSSFKMPASMPCISSYPYRWPLPFTIGPMFTPNGFPFPPHLLNSLYNMGNTTTGYTTTNSTMDPKFPQGSTNDQKEAIKSAECLPFFNMKFPPVMLHIENKPKVFKKPKNEYEYKLLMEATRLNPNEFPNILKCEKTKFLSNLGIAPKSICSSRTLKRFRQELRKKKLLNRACMIYRERKILRDRNKLKKRSHERRRYSYLGMSSVRNSVSTRLAKSSSNAKRSESRYLKFSRRSNSDKKCQTLKKGPIEIIDIATSEDETRGRNCSDKENEDNKENCGVRFTENQPENTEETLSKSTLAKLFHIQDTTQNAHENKGINNKHVSEEKNQFPLNEISQIPSAAFNVQNSLNVPLNMRRILLPKTVNHDSSRNKSVNFSNIPFQVRRFPPPPQIVGSYAGHGKVTNHTVSRINEVPVSIRHATSALLTPRSDFVLPSQNNNAPRIVYPIQVPKTKGTKVFIVNNQQKGAFCFIPQYHRPILPRNSPRTETSTAPNLQEAKVPNSLLSVTSQLPKPVMTGRTAFEQLKNSSKKFIRNGEKEKIDIREEMARISKWIYGMKANLNPCMFKYGIEKSVQKLISQLDVGIYMVRKAKKSLEELESSTDIRKQPSETVE